MIRAILFDAYGTLFDTGTGSVQAAAEILARNGRQDLSPAEFYAQWKRRHHWRMKNLRPFQREAELYALDLEELYQEYGFSRNAREDVAVMLQYQGTRVAYPEVKRVLDSLLSRYQLCVASTTDTAPLEQDLKRAGLVFHRVFTSQSLKVYKPDHEFYTTILHALSLRPAEALFVGDSLTDDVQGPQDVGMRACWLNRKGIVPEGVKPDFQIHSLEQLPSVLESIEREL